MVEPQEWRLGDVLGRRRERLLDVPTPEDLLARMSGEAEDASRGGLIQLDWESSRESPGYFRLVAQIPLDETTFDQLFNGRSGYRAQYYLSPEEGILFNRDILDSLAPAIGTAFEATPLSIEFNLVEQSLRAPRSKIWVYKDQEAFNEAVASTINPDRWVENNAVPGT